jgi:hypothetical protein
MLKPELLKERATEAYKLLSMCVNERTKGTVKLKDCILFCRPEEDRLNIYCQYVYNNDYGGHSVDFRDDYEPVEGVLLALKVKELAHL